MERNLFLIALIFLIITGCGKKESANTAKSSSIAEKTGSSAEDSSKLKSTKKEDQRKEGDSKFQKPVFQLKNWQSDVKKPEVEDDAANVSVEKMEPGEAEEAAEDIKVPSDCLAAKLVSKTEKIIWTPKWYFEGVGGVKLPTMVLSNDSSVLAIVETTGTDKGPNGSRIVLLNTYNWQVLKIHEFEENNIDKISFLPDGNRMVFWSLKQISIKKPYELIMIGVEKGDILSISKEIKADVSDIIATEKNVFAKISDENIIYCFDSSNISKAPRKIKSLNQKGVFALSPDKGRIVLAGEKYLEIFECEGMEMLSKFSFDEEYAPENVLFAGKNEYIAVSAYNKPGFFFKDGQKKQFCDISGRSLAYNKDEKTLIYEKYLNNEICFAEVPDLSEKGHFTPSKINPRTQGTAIFLAYFKDNSRYTVIDSYGNLSVFTKYLKSNKWKKRVVISPKK